MGSFISLPDFLWRIFRFQRHSAFFTELIATKEMINEIVAMPVFSTDMHVFL